MVVNTVSPSKPLGKIPEECVSEGNYRLVGWDIDTTGRKLTDEICQIAAYTPESQFSQHAMPYADLNFHAQIRHNLCVITTFLYRMLGERKTYKIIKSKSEISTLIDFLTWLEETKGADCDGIILVCHETRKIAPSMLLEGLRRYNLIERFSEVVKGFANSFCLAEAKCADTVKSFSLGMLSRVFLDKEEFMGNAVNRAKLCYMVVQHLGQSERQDLEGSGDMDISEQRYTVDLIRPYAATIAAEEKEIIEMKAQNERQLTFRPIFKSFMYNPLNRQYAHRICQLLAQQNLDSDKLKATWEASGRDGLEEFLKKELTELNNEELTELLEILDCFYDPAKEAIQPKKQSPKAPKNKKNEKKKNNSISDKSATTSTPVTPETEDPPVVKTESAVKSEPVVKPEPVVKNEQVVKTEPVAVAAN